tara:strand:+ start:2296 stop:2559 length:264 start_codon:yes stop_codon:yes gene_type:complete
MAESELALKSILKVQAEAALKTDQIKHNELAIESEEKQLEGKSAEIRAQMQSEAKAQNKLRAAADAELMAKAKKIESDLNTIEIQGK